MDAGGQSGGNDPDAIANEPNRASPHRYTLAIILHARNRKSCGGRNAFTERGSQPHAIAKVQWA